MVYPHPPLRPTVPTCRVRPSRYLAAGVGRGLALVVTIGATLLMCFFSMHSSYVSSLAYSSPSIVIEAGRTQSGARILYDDYREAYYWLRHNTDPDAKIMSWWDYGYQVSQSLPCVCVYFYVPFVFFAERHGTAFVFVAVRVFWRHSLPISWKGRELEVPRVVKGVEYCKATDGIPHTLYLKCRYCELQPNLGSWLASIRYAIDGLCAYTLARRPIRMNHPAYPLHQFFW